jgi:hypothetical protein
LRGKYNAGGAGGFGLIGALIAPPKYEIEISGERDLIKELEIATPQSCPPAICVPVGAALVKQQSASYQNANTKDKLADLNELKKKGLITQKDYDIKKAEILKNM